MQINVTIAGTPAKTFHNTRTLADRLAVREEYDKRKRAIVAAYNAEMSAIGLSGESWEAICAANSAALSARVARVAALDAMFGTK